MGVFSKLQESWSKVSLAAREVVTVSSVTYFVLFFSTLFSYKQRNSLASAWMFNISSSSALNVS